MNMITGKQSIIIKKLFEGINSRYFFPLLLIGFAFWFAYDLYTFKKAFIHPDFITWYYPLRQWFTQRLLSGEFPLWNPFFGIGTPAEAWATIPIDIYTILEIVFGPQYHYFQLLQFILILLTSYYVFIKLNIKPGIATISALIFFMSPWVNHFSFYFMKPNSFIANILLFYFFYKWFNTENRHFLLLIFLATVFSMFGTKPEYWFYQTVFYTFFSLMASFMYNHDFLKASKIFFLAMLAMLIGILAHSWQLNLLIQIISNTARLIKPDIWPKMYHNLWLSILDSSLLKMLFMGIFFYMTLQIKKLFSMVVFLIIGGIFLGGLGLWKLPIIASFIASPILIGAILGALLSILFHRLNWQEHLKTFILFWLFIYYWCRPGAGDLGELEAMRLAPDTFMVLVSALVWLGCTRFKHSKLVRLSYFSILFIFLMREQGQIILFYLTGLLWMPIRDNYFIDFAVSIIAVVGLATLNLKDLSRVDLSLRPKISTSIRQYLLERKLNHWVISIIGIGIIIFSFSSNFYYIHPDLVREAPLDYPYFSGIPTIRKVIREFESSPETRIYFVNDDAKAFTYGFGSSLLEGVGQVTMYSSLIPKRYNDWMTYRNTGIRPGEKWRMGYPAGYTDKTISRLPRENSLMDSKHKVYFYTVISKPPLEKNYLKFLGVEQIIKIFPISGANVIGALPPHELKNKLRQLKLKDIQRIKGITLWPGIKESLLIEKSLFSARLNNPVPRSFLLSGVTEEKVYELMNEMNPIIADTNNFIKTKSYIFPLTPAKIERYQPEHISINTKTKEDMYLVLSDLHHPFWHVKVDGKETEIIPAFYIFRGVKLSPGEHQIDFYCEVPHFKASVFISLLIMLLGIILPLVWYRK